MRVGEREIPVILSTVVTLVWLLIAAEAIRLLCKAWTNPVVSRREVAWLIAQNSSAVAWSICASIWIPLLNSREKKTDWQWQLAQSARVVCECTLLSCLVTRVWLIHFTLRVNALTQDRAWMSIIDVRWHWHSQPGSETHSHQISADAASYSDLSNLGALAAHSSSLHQNPLPTAQRYLGRAPKRTFLDLAQRYSNSPQPRRNPESKSSATFRLSNPTFKSISRHTRSLKDSVLGFHIAQQAIRGLDTGMNDTHNDNPSSHPSSANGDSEDPSDCGLCLCFNCCCSDGDSNPNFQSSEDDSNELLSSVYDPYRDVLFFWLDFQFTLGNAEWLARSVTVIGLMFTMIWIMINILLKWPLWFELCEVVLFYGVSCTVICMLFQRIRHGRSRVIIDFYREVRGMLIGFLVFAMMRFSVVICRIQGSLLAERCFRMFCTMSMSWVCIASLLRPLYLLFTQRKITLGHRYYSALEAGRRNREASEIAVNRSLTGLPSHRGMSLTWKHSAEATLSSHDKNHESENQKQTILAHSTSHLSMAMSFEFSVNWSCISEANPDLSFEPPIKQESFANGARIPSSMLAWMFIRWDVMYDQCWDASQLTRHVSAVRSLGLNGVLSNPTGVSVFMQYLKREMCSESLLAFIEFDQFEQRFSAEMLEVESDNSDSSPPARSTTMSAFGRGIRGLIDRTDFAVGGAGNSSSDEDEESGGGRTDENGDPVAPIPRSSSNNNANIALPRPKPGVFPHSTLVFGESIRMKPSMDTVFCSLMSKYVSPGARYEVNVSYAARKELLSCNAHLKSTRNLLDADCMITPEIFAAIKKELLYILKHNFDRWADTLQFIVYAQGVKLPTLTQVKSAQ